MSYKCGTGVLLHVYLLNGSVLRRVDKFRDLGIVMIPSLGAKSVLYTSQ